MLVDKVASFSMIKEGLKLVFSKFLNLGSEVFNHRKDAVCTDFPDRSLGIKCYFVGFT